MEAAQLFQKHKKQLLVDQSNTLYLHNRILQEIEQQREMLQMKKKIFMELTNKLQKI